MQIPDSIKSKRLKRGNLGSIEQDEFTDIIIGLISALGGGAERQVVLRHIQQIFKSQLKEPDHEVLKSQTTPKERWAHNVDWAKRKLVTNGFLLKPAESPYGTWILTEKGKMKAMSL